MLEGHRDIRLQCNAEELDYQQFISQRLFNV